MEMELVKLIKKKVCKYILLIIVLVIWYMTTRFGIVNEYVLPSPKKVWDTFLKMVYSKEIFIDIIISLWRISRGFIIAFVIAFVLGIRPT